VQADGDYVFLQGMDKNYRARLLRQSVLDADEYAIKRKSLQARNLLVDPNLRDYTYWRPKMTIDYQPPTINDISLGKLPSQKSETKKRKPKFQTINMRGKINMREKTK